MAKTATCFFIFSGLLVVVLAKAQDPHFGGQQDMNIWYNPALKINKFPLVHLNMRRVSYPNIISYTSKAITFELPFVGKDVTDYNNVPFVNFSASVSTDNASGQFMTASTAMMSLSYALPLNNYNTYLALGFQGNYSFNRVGTGTTYVFPDHFDKYGALSWSMMIDPALSDLNYEYFSAGIGAAEIFEAKNCALHIELDDKLQNIKLSMEKRKNFYLIYKEAINNIAKYAACKDVWINMQMHHNEVMLHIKDNGNGFDVAKRKNGNGLFNMQQRADMLKGRLIITSNISEGTLVELRFGV